MAEFCPECFLKLHPEYTKHSLVVMRGLDWCEECGKPVNKIVINVQNPFTNQNVCAIIRINTERNDYSAYKS